MNNSLDKIVSLCKRRGFIYPGSEIYGGLANTWDYGPLGVEMLKNIKDLWWRKFVHQREDIFGIETGIIQNPKIWQASGHTERFFDSKIDCRKCKLRIRADHLIQDILKKNVEGRSTDELETLINRYKIPCPSCGSFSWTKVRRFNLLFETHLGILKESQSLAYLRGETAQGMFVNFKKILDSFSPKLPFGIAQIGKGFRNEITKGNFIFRTLEFDMMEIEYFIRQDDWQKTFSKWKEIIWQWAIFLGISSKKIHWRQHTKDELSHYSKKTEDLEYEFPFGFKELYGLAYRTDFDLKNHTKYSGIDLSYRDPKTGTTFFPHVIEPTFGVNRTMLTILFEAYNEDKVGYEKRVVLKIIPQLAPYKVAVFPLLANKQELVDLARKIFIFLQKTDYNIAWDDIGNIGKRYRRQDEIGTPWCVTVDHETLKDETITVRDRDTMVQERVKWHRLKDYLSERLS